MKLSLEVNGSQESSNEESVSDEELDSDEKFVSDEETQEVSCAEGIVGLANKNDASAEADDPEGTEWV